MVGFCCVVSGFCPLLVISCWSLVLAGMVVSVQLIIGLSFYFIPEMDIIRNDCSRNTVLRNAMLEMT